VSSPEALNQPCEFCGARPGKPCTRTNPRRGRRYNKYYTYIHVARQATKGEAS
jgi:hypothetical protein